MAKIDKTANFVKNEKIRKADHCRHEGREIRVRAPCPVSVRTIGVPMFAIKQTEYPALLS